MLVYRTLALLFVALALLAGCTEKPPAKPENKAAPASTTTRVTSAPPPSASENPFSFTTAIPTLPPIPGPGTWTALAAAGVAAAIVLAQRRDDGPR